MDKKVFLFDIHNFRGFAILLIVLVHASIALPWANEDARRLMTITISNSTILFVFIAGFLFKHLNAGKFDYGKYLKRRFLVVILPYFVVSIPALVDKLVFDRVGEHWWLTQSFDEQPVVMKVVEMLLTGRHNGTFWFMPMIAIIYLLSAPLIAFSRKRTFLYIAPVIVVAGLFTVAYGYRSNIWLSLLYFLPVYLFGMWVCVARDFFYRHTAVIMPVALGGWLLITILEITSVIPFDELMSLRDVNYLVLMFNLNKLKVLLLCIFCLLVTHSRLNRNVGILGLSGQFSFGIFFIHLYVIAVLQRLYIAGWFPIAPLNIGRCIFFGLLVFGISMGIVSLIRLILGERSKYVIGS